MDSRYVVLTLCLILTQTKASFFSEVSYSLESWSSSIGHYLSSTDWKNTYDCTVFKVQNVYYCYDVVPDYYKKCIDEQRRSNETTSTETPTTVPVTILNTEPEHDKIEKEIQRFETGLLNETRTLTSINIKLQEEVLELSKHVNKELEKIQNEQKQQSIEKVMEQIEKLHEEEAVLANNTDQGVHAVFDKVLKKLDRNNIAKDYVRKEIKEVLQEMDLNNKSTVEKEILTWKQEEMEELKEVKDLLKRKRHLSTPKVIKKRIPVTVKSTDETISSVISTESMPSSIASTEASATRVTPTATQSPDTGLQSALELLGKSRESASIMAKAMEHSRQTTNTQ